MNRKRLFLIDGSAQFYRAYFAFIRNPLVNSKGENTSASYGFVLFLMKILEEKPDYLAVVFDTIKPTFRHKKYEDYKATREKMPEDMIAQYPRVTELVKAFNIPFIEAPDYREDQRFSYEADDVIGTLAKQAEQHGIETFVATSDKDYMQLISTHIKIYNTRPGKDSEIIDEQFLKTEYGLSPGQIVDYLALMGDSSDNVPGVPKIGQKTAQQLLQDYQSMEGIYKNIEKIPGKAVHDSLLENRKLADLSKDLVTIDTSVPLDYDIESLKYQTPDARKLVELFEELEFRSLISKIQDAGQEKPLSASGGYDTDKQTYQLIQSPRELRELAGKLQEQTFLVFDTETTGLDPFSESIIGIALSWKAHEAYYVPLNLPDTGLTEALVVETLRPVFENPAIKKGGQNIKFDALMLHQHGIQVKGIEFDTLIASFLITPTTRQNKLDILAEKYLGYKMIPIESLIGKKGKKQKSMSEIPVEEVCPYACEDADITWQLKMILEKKLAETETETLFRNVEMPLVEVLLKMELNGVSLDVEFLKQLSEVFGEEAARLQEEIYGLANETFNINSPQQLGTVLFDKLGIHKELGGRRPRRTPTGQYSTSEDVLLKYSDHPLVNKILDFRKLTKLKSTYVDALPLLVRPRTARIHTSYSQTVAATGRLSSSDPNLQNIPIRGEKGREIRKAFIPGSPENYILSADYSQVELRMMAHVSGDLALKEAFERGEDIHSTTAAAIFNVPIAEVDSGHRRKAKAVNFGIIYGISRFGLASRLGISTLEAEEIIRNYFIRFPKVNDYIINIISFAREHHYVTTLLNRRRYIPDISSRNTPVRQNAERIAINTTIQGSAADLIKLAMINIHRRLLAEHLQTKMILQVHDELVFEVPENEIETLKPLVKREMEQAMKLDVPLKVDLGMGKNWLEAH